MKITITTIALSVLLPGVAFSQEIDVLVWQKDLRKEEPRKTSSSKNRTSQRGLARKGVNRPKRMQQSEISDELQTQKDRLKDLQQTLQTEINQKVNEFGNDVTREEIKQPSIHSKKTTRTGLKKLETQALFGRIGSQSS